MERINLKDKEEKVKSGPGNLLRVPLHSPMSIQNESPERLVFLVIKTPHPDAVKKDSPKDKNREGSFVNLIRFPLLKAGKDAEFREWFRHSSELFAKHQGFISRTLLKSTEGTDRYAAVVEHESKETFMAMHLSDDRQALQEGGDTDRGDAGTPFLRSGGFLPEVNGMGLS
jgi:heme-degrading monooxygenase HmoA